MTSCKNFIVDFGFRIQEYLLHQIGERSSQYLGKYASFFTFPFRDTFIQKLAMATPEINENCHYIQNDPFRCKIKLEKFHFDILCCCGVIEKSLPGGVGVGVLIVFVSSGTHLQLIGLSVSPFDLSSQQASHFSTLIFREERYQRSSLFSVFV